MIVMQIFMTVMNDINDEEKIFMHHTDEDIAIINRDNKEELDLTWDIGSTKDYFSLNSEAKCYYKDGFIYYDGKQFIDTQKLN